MSAIAIDRAKMGVEVTLRFTNGHIVTGILEERDETTVRIGTAYYKRDMIEAAFHVPRGRRLANA